MRYVPFLLIALLVVGCAGNSSEPGVFGNNSSSYGKDSRPAIDSDRAVKSLKAGVAAQFVDGTNTMGFGLLKQQDLSKNVAISPLAISLGLLIPMNGAEGSTLVEMQRALGVDKIMLEDVNTAADQTGRALGGLNMDTMVRIANSVFTHSTVNLSDEFKGEQQARFGANFKSLDFDDVAAKNSINEWVRKATDGHVTSMIAKTESAKPVLLANAMFISAPLKSPFATAATKTSGFTLGDGKAVETPMMSQTASVSARLGDDPVVRLPYRGDQLELILAMPKKGTSVAQWVAGLNWKEFSAGLPGKAAVIDVTLPRFELSPAVSLMAGLQKLGVGSLFSDQADLKKMGLDKIVWSDAIHRTWLAVEEMSVPAVTTTAPKATDPPATAATPKKEIAPTPKSTGAVVFDRPFLVVVRDVRTGQILIAGVVNDPRPEELK